MIVDLNLKADLNIHVYSHEGRGRADTQQDRIEELLRTVLTNTEKITMTEQEFGAVLQKVDLATTHIGENTTAIAGTVDSMATLEASNGQILETISSEIDTLLANNPGISQSLSDAVTAIQAKVDNAKAASDTLKMASDAVKAQLDAQVPALQAIATKGAGSPVPVPPSPSPNLPLVLTLSSL
jgi:hypothetical protein